MKTIKPYRLHRFYEGIPNQYVVAVPEEATYLGIYLVTTNSLSYFGEREERVYLANFIVNNAVVTTMSADSQDQKQQTVTLEQRFFYIFGEHDEIAPEVLEKLTLLDKISLEQSQLYIFHKTK